MQKIACFFIFIMVFSTGISSSVKSCLKGSESTTKGQKSISWALDPTKPLPDKTTQDQKDFAATKRQLKERAASEAFFLEKCNQIGCTPQQMKQINQKKIQEIQRINKQTLMQAKIDANPHTLSGSTLKKTVSFTCLLNQQPKVQQKQATNLRQEQIAFCRAMFPWVVGCFTVTSFALLYYSIAENSCITT